MKDIDPSSDPCYISNKGKNVFDIIKFNQDVSATGQEMDWEIIGVTRDIYTNFKKGDQIAIKFTSECNNGNVMIYTYNKNYNEELEGGDNPSPFIVFYNIPKNSFTIIKNDIKLRDCKEFETQNHQNYKYYRNRG